MRVVAAAEVMPRWGTLASGDSREKGPDDWVTVADLAAEAALRAGLAAIDPAIPTVGEEEVSADPSILGRLSGEAAWILDPVDGTRAFRDGLPGFGMIVALALGGRVDAGWILDCVGGTLVCARAGMGAFTHRADGSLSPLKRPAPCHEPVGTASKGVFEPTPGGAPLGQVCLGQLHGRHALQDARGRRRYPGRHGPRIGSGDPARPDGLTAMLESIFSVARVRL